MPKIVKKLQNIDGVSGAFIITLDRKNRMDWANMPVWSEALGLIVPRPGEEIRLFAFIGPFQPKVKVKIISESRMMRNGQKLVT